ncbi:hypothetical protein DINM_022537 [Dirofilaria immitis]|nr:hypothetical protein [Dirofilaria immitis]
MAFPYILCLLMIFILLLWRYRGWLLSLAVAKIFRCRSVRLSKCGLFYMEHIRLCLSGGIIIEIDDLRLTISFFNTHYTKPFIITISDIRIEGEFNEQLSLTSSYKKQYSHKNFEGYLYWLQYISAIIRTARIVFRGLTPGSLLHSTFQQLQLDGYRDREGNFQNIIQIELSCKLLQAKLFSRGTTQNTEPLFVLSLGLSVCCNVPLGILILKRFAARITDPQLILSDDLLEYFHDHLMRQKTEKNTSNPFFTSLNVVCFLNTSLKLDIENLALRCTANMDYSKIRTVSARLNVASILVENNLRFAVVLTGVNVDDQTREILFNCNEFDAKLNREMGSPKNLFIDVKVLNPRLVMNQKAIVEWIDYYHNVRRRISTESYFDDDFSTASVVPMEMNQFCCMSLSVEVNSFHCSLMLANKQEITAGLELGTFRVNDHFDPHFCHTWGTVLSIGALLTQYSRYNGTRRLLIKLVECQIEYEEELIQQMALFMSSLLCSGTSSATCTASAFQPHPPPQNVSAIQLSLENIALFILARHSLYLILSIEQLRVDALPSMTLSMLALNSKILQGIVTSDKFISWDDSAQIKSKQICGSSDRLMMRLSRLPLSWEWVLLVESTANLIWSTTAHKFETNLRSFWAQGIFQDISLVPFQHRNIQSCSNRIPSTEKSRVRDVTLGNAITTHTVHEPYNNRNAAKFRIEKQAFDAGMDLGRNEFKNLKNRTNKLWIWSADVVMFVFPYDYNFAAGYDEIINAWKWIKLVHEWKRKPFIIESPLPSDLRFSIKNASLQINDDPFEVQLQNNYELMVDEVYECERRRQMLDQKLEQLQKTPFSITKTPKFMSNGPKIAEFEKASMLVIRAYADITLHGKDNVVKYIKNFNPESPFPEGMEFSTLWARAVEMDCDDWVMQFRDYPLPYVLMKDAHFWGYLVGRPRSIRTNIVTLPEPWGQYIVERNMCPLKYYYDLSCEIKELNCTYGPCWEPCLSMISLCWNNVSLPSSDPSPPLSFWDKIRLLLHGRFSMLCQNLVTSMLASTDPYNSTELVEICWREFGFDWIADQFCVQTDMDAFVRTASKYDESRVLHLPGFKFSVKMDWACIGDPHDHHSAQPCAPDKLPEYSSTNLEHDSYRAFRSTHLDLVLTLEVKQPDGAVANSQCPQILLYANTFRWLEFLKNTMTTVNRPVKRGRLFGEDKTKKAHSVECHASTLSNHVLDVVLFIAWSTDDQRKLTFNLIIGTSYFAKQRTKDRLSYTREARPQNNANSSSNRRVKLSESDEAVHRLTIHDLRASWTPENRDTCLAIADGVHKAHILRRILGTDALKTPSFTESGIPPLSSTTLNGVNTAKPVISRLQSDSESNKSVSTSAFLINKCLHRSRYGLEGRATEENDMLQRLIDEASTKLVAYDEETTDIPSDMLQGIALCTSDDVALINWQIDLINSQAVLRGKEKDGFVLLTAARASVTQRIYALVWKKSQLLSKKSWCATLSGMQYFAPLVMSQHLNSSNCSPESISQGFHWLNRDIIEEKHHGNVAQIEGKLQLQRVVSRCSCQMYFCYFSDTLDLDTRNIPYSMSETNEAGEIWGQPEPVSTNPEQYQMVMNIVNQLVLFVDPRKKESDRRRQRLRFELQLKDVDEVKSSIFAMQCYYHFCKQAELRDVIAVIRSLERRLFFLNRQLQESGNDTACYKEKQVERMRKLVNATEEEQAVVARRYTRTARIDNSGEHLLEIGTVQVTNLLPDTIYKHTLQAQNASRRKTERQPASIRVVCREKAPGIFCLMLRNTGGVFKNFRWWNFGEGTFRNQCFTHECSNYLSIFPKNDGVFFPGRNIDKEDQRNLDTNEEPQNNQGVSVGQWLQGAMNGSFRRTNESSHLRDDIDRMKERAQENNVFLYIKIPEITRKRANDERLDDWMRKQRENIEDVDRFQLVFPLCEYHEKNWTWLDLALAIKQRCRRVLLQQFMKQKLLRNRLAGIEHPSIEIDEDEKNGLSLEW